MIERDFDITITEEMRKRFIDKKKTSKRKKGEKIEEDLKRILIIGPKGGKMCHFSENITYIAKKEGYDVKFFSPNELKFSDLQLQNHITFNLSNLLFELKKWKPQLILIDECGLFFNNYTTIPVFYHHREFKRPPSVFYPTVAFFWHRDIITYFETQFAPVWMAQVPYIEVMEVATNPKLFELQEKTVKGIIGIGGRETFEQAYKIDELANIADLMILEEETEMIKQFCDHFYETPITDEKYRELLPQCETIWIPMSIRQYTSRRMVDAMLCKTICIIKLENKRHEKFLEDMGFRKGIHYIGINSIEDINSDLLSNLKGIKLEDMVNSAYSITLQKHTYKNRFDQIIELYHGIKKQKK